VTGGTGRAYVAAAVLAALSIATVVFSVVLRLRFDLEPADRFSGAANIVMGIAWPVLALLVLRQQPGNRLVWLFLVVGLSMALYLGGTNLSTVLFDRDRPGAALAEWVGIGFGEVGWPLLWLTAQSFPTGRPVPTPLFRWAYRLSIVWYVLSFCQVLFSAESRGTAWREGNPLRIGWLETVLDTLFSPFGAVQDAVGINPVFLAIIGFGVASLTVRFRRGTRTERGQLRTFLVALLLCFALIPVSALFPADQQGLVVAVAIFLLPGSFGLAILRHRLYDLDRLVSRTATYSLLTGALVAVYLGLVTLTTDVLDLGSSLSAAVATLAAAALFQPLRHVLQRAVDRRFNRARYDALAQVDAFAGRLRTPATAEAITGDLLDVVGRTVQPSSATVWLVAR
jgi:hypothetical protein